MGKRNLVSNRKRQIDGEIVHELAWEVDLDLQDGSVDVNLSGTQFASWQLFERKHIVMAREVVARADATNAARLSAEPVMHPERQYPERVFDGTMPDSKPHGWAFVSAAMMIAAVVFSFWIVW